MPDIFELVEVKNNVPHQLMQSEGQIESSTDSAG